MDKKKFLIIALIIFFAAFLVWNWRFQDRVQAKEFVGHVQEVQGNSIMAQGVFILLTRPENSDYKNNKKAEILVTPETKFTKTIWYMPKPVTGASFDPDKIRKEEVPGVLSELTQNVVGMPIRVLSSKNIFNKAKFTASEVQYLKQVYPDLD